MKPYIKKVTRIFNNTDISLGRQNGWLVVDPARQVGWYLSTYRAAKTTLATQRFYPDGSMDLLFQSSNRNWYLKLGWNQR